MPAAPPSLTDLQCRARSLMDVELLRRRLDSEGDEAVLLLACEYREVWSKLVEAGDALGPKLAAWREHFASFRFLLARDDRWLTRGLRFAQHALSAPAAGAVAREARAWLRRSRPPTGLLVRHRDGGHEPPRGVLDTGKPVAALAPLPDGRRVASGGLDGAIAVWDRETGERLAILTGHGAPIRALRVCPPYLASCAADGTVVLWNLDDHAKAASVAGHQGAANAIAVLADGQRIATAGEEGAVRIWKLPSLASEAAFGLGRTCLRAILAHREKIVAAGGDRALPAWWASDPAGRDIVLLDGPTAAVTGLAPHRERHVVASCEDGALYVWNGDETMTKRLAVRRGDPLLAIESIPDTYVIAACRNGVLYEVSLDGTEEINDLGRHDGPVTAAALSPSGCAVSGGQDGIIAWWSTATAKRRHGHGGAVRALAAVASSLYSGGADGVVQCWDGAGNSIAMAPAASSPVTAMTVRPGVVFTGHETGELCVCSFDDGHLVRVRQLEAHDAEIDALAYVPEAGLLISAGWDGAVRVWKKDQGSHLAADGILARHTSCVLGLAVDGQRDLVLSGGWERDVLVHSLSRRELRGRLHGHTSPVVALATCGATLVSADDSGRVGFCGLARDSDVATQAGHGKAVTALVTTAERAVTGGEDGTVCVWHAVERRRLHRIEASRGAVRGLAPSPDGRSCAVAAEDGSLRVLSLESGEISASWLLGSAATACAWLGDAIACGTRGGEVLLFDLLASRQIVAASWHPERPLVATLDDTGTVSLGEWHDGAAYLEPLAERRIEDFATPRTEGAPEIAWSACGQALRIVRDGAVVVLGAHGLDPASDPGSGWLSPEAVSCDRRWRLEPGGEEVRPATVR